MGFDNDCIVNIQSLSGEYFCPVCRTLVNPNEALQSKCTHLYCKPCLAQITSTIKACPYDGCLVTEADSKPLIESNKTLAETLGKILVHCLYHRSGCHWQGPLSDCSTHSSACPFGNCVVACSRCTVHIVHREVQEHLQTCTGLNPQAKLVTDSTQTQTQTQAQTQTQTQSQTQTQTQTATQSVAPAQLPAGAATITQPQPAKPATQPNQEQNQLLLQQQRQYQIYQQLHLQQQRQILLLQAQQHLHQILPRQQILPQPQPRPPYNPRNQTQTNLLRPPQYRQPVLPQAVPAHHPSYPQFLPRQQILQPLPPPPPPQPQPQHISGGQFAPLPPPPPPAQMTQPQSHTFLPSQGHQQIQQRPVMQNIPQQHVLQQNFTGQSGQVQIQLHQQTQFVPPGPPQNYPAHLQPQQAVAVAHTLRPHHQFQHFSQLPGQQSQQFVQSGPLTTSVKQEREAVSQYTAEKLENSVDDNALRMKKLIQEHGSEHGKPLVKDEYTEVNAMKVDSSEPRVEITVKEEGNLGTSDSLTDLKSTEIPALEEVKNVTDPLNDSSLPGKDSADVNMTDPPNDSSLQGKDSESFHQNVKQPENIRPLVTSEQEKTDGHESQLGQQRPVNPVETDTVHNHKPHKSDSDSHGSFGQPSGKSVEQIIDGAPDLLKDQTQGLDKEEIQEGSGKFPRLSFLGSPKFESYFCSSRTTDKGHSKFEIDKSPSGSNNYDDARFKMESGLSEEVPSRFLPTSSSFDQDFRTLVREHGISSREYEQEQNPFGEESRSFFNLPQDQPGSSSNGNRFTLFSGNSRIGDHLTGELTRQDNLNRHLRGEFDGSHQLAGESFSGPRLGEPGFRSKYTVDVFPSEGGSNLGESSAFDQLRKRRLASIVWWCRICGMDCETEEGLDYHFQDRDHQKMAMDVVLQIKQQNAKKPKIPNDHSRGDANKSRTTHFDNRANWP